MSFRLTEPKVLQVLMLKPKEKAAAKKQSLSPCSYDQLKAFNTTQTLRVSGGISKYKTDNFVNKAVKSNKWKLGPGHYDHMKCLSFVTKGASKGWK